MARPRLPDGTVTFMFTDVEGSTRLLKRIGSRYGAVLDRHHALLRQAIEGHGGRVIDTQGEAFFVVFRRAKDAVAAAIEVLHLHAREPWPDDQTLRVRVGLHTAEPELSAGGYFGMGVHRAARICAIGHGGQVLLSRSTAGLVDEDERPDAELVDLGEHLLKDLERPERIYQLAAAGLENEFPPLRSLSGLAESASESELPSGTVTFVATDLVGYSGMVRSVDLATLGGRMVEYERLVRGAIDDSGGALFEWVGDSCIAVFRSAAEATVAAIDVAARLRTAHWQGHGPPRARIGVHTGEAGRWRSGYVGLALVRVLRVCAAAEPGQVLASPTTENVMSGATSEVRFQPLAERELEDFPRPVVLYELLPAGATVTPFSAPTARPGTAAVLEEDGFVAPSSRSAQPIALRTTKSGSPRFGSMQSPSSKLVGLLLPDVAGRCRSVSAA